MKENYLTEIKKPVSELELTIAAHNGDQVATIMLYNRYRLKLIGMIGKYNYMFYKLSQAEMESEVAEIFMHKLRNVFKPEKVKKASDVWSFSFILTGGIKNLRYKLANQFRNYDMFIDSYNETDVPSGSARLDQCVLCALEWNDYEFTKYAPENKVLKGENLEIKKKILYQKLTLFQKTILKFRQSGMPVWEVADNMGCSYRKVRKEIINIKEIAHLVFST